MYRIDEYVLGDGNEEHSRLLSQCDYYRPAALELLDRLNVRSGWRAVDFGCGPLGVLDLLSDRVGPTGHVIGLEYQAHMVGWAEQARVMRCLSNVEVIQGDARASGLPAGSSDLAHARLLLSNIQRPEEVLREMVRVVRPGGWVALQEVDWVSWTCIPAHPAWDELRGVIASCWSGDVHIGSRTAHLLESAGLEEVTATATAQVVRAGDYQYDQLLYFAERVRPRLVAELGADRYRQIVRELRDFLHQRKTLVVQEMLFQASGRVPIKSRRTSENRNTPDI
jgi:ubiquinone/menaquinone biosynthesis C-methylase UbiE